MPEKTTPEESQSAETQPERNVDDLIRYELVESGDEAGIARITINSPARATPSQPTCATGSPSGSGRRRRTPRSAS